MRLGPTYIEDTFAEAFRMRYTRIILSAHDQYWTEAAAREMTGYASSIISCDAEAGIESRIPRESSPDGRPAVSVLLFGFSADALGSALANRVGQCAMTCATSAVFDGLRESETRLPLGKHVRFFGDGYQRSKIVAGVRYWRIPVMDGEFLIEESVGCERGVAGGNIIIQGVSLDAALDAARRAVEATTTIAGVITPFPAGVVRSGSKVGSRYSKLKASTNDAFCPSLRGRVATSLHGDATVAYEIVINGVDEAAVGAAMASAMRAAAGPEIVAISAGNYGGSLGKFHFRLREVLS